MHPQHSRPPATTQLAEFQLSCEWKCLAMSQIWHASICSNMLRYAVIRCAKQKTVSWSPVGVVCPLCRQPWDCGSTWYSWPARPTPVKIQHQRLPRGHSSQTTARPFCYHWLPCLQECVTSQSQVKTSLHLLLYHRCVSCPCLVSVFMGRPRQL